MTKKEIEEFVVKHKENIKYLTEDKLYHSKNIHEYYNLPITKHSLRSMNIILQNNNIKIFCPNITSLESRIIEKYKNDINYWFNNKELVKIVKNSLNNRLIVNTTGDTKRYVVALKYHKRASKANQVKAHILLWELHNKKPFPDKHVLEPLDGNFLNLKIDNLKLWTLSDYRSKVATGSRNHFYINGKYEKVAYKGGWKSKAKEVLKNNKCAKCNDSNKRLNVHQIISYHLFEDKNLANNLDNLICLCDSCHAKLHQNNFEIIKGILSETVKLKLIELLGTLKPKDKNLQYFYDFSFKSISSQGE